MAVTLRPYQEQAVGALLQDARLGICPVGVIPTGGGKTVVMREIAQRWLRQSPKDHVLLLAHRTRLLTQAQERFAGVPTQVVSAGLGLWQEPQPGTVTVASIQTVAGMTAMQNMPWSLVLVDEAHRVGMDSSEEEGQYRGFLDALGKRSDPPIIGVTATPWRIEKGNRHVPIFGQDGFFQKASCWIQPEALIAEGYLLQPRMASVQYPIPTTGIELPHGELATANVQGYKKTDFDLRIEEMLHLTEDRRHVLIFADSIKESHAIARALELRGKPACVLHGEHEESVRNREIEKFRTGAFPYLVNVDVFTEGLDVPEIDAVVLHRRTQSVVRYLQMAGRGLRPTGVRPTGLRPQGNGQQSDCLIVDFGQHVERLGPIEAARGRDARPVSWRSRRLRRSTSAENAGPSDWMGRNDPKEAPLYTEAEATFCVPVQKMNILPLPVRGNRAFYLLKFWVDDPGGGHKPLAVEQKLHLWDATLQHLFRRFSALSGVPLPKYGTTNKEEAWADAVQRMTNSTTGFLSYAPFAIRVRWSGRSGKWMVDGLQWSGKAKMHITREEERLLSAWVQKAHQSVDPLDQGVYRLLYRLAHEGVLDLQQEGGAKPAPGQLVAPVQPVAPGQPVRQKPVPVPTQQESAPALPVPAQPAISAQREPMKEKTAELQPPAVASSPRDWPPASGWPPAAPIRSFPPVPDHLQAAIDSSLSSAATPAPMGEAELAAAWGQQQNRLPPQEPASSEPAISGPTSTPAAARFG